MSELQCFLTKQLNLLPEITQLINQVTVDVKLNKPCVEELRRCLEEDSCPDLDTAFTPYDANPSARFQKAFHTCLQEYPVDDLKVIVSGFNLDYNKVFDGLILFNILAYFEYDELTAFKFFATKELCMKQTDTTNRFGPKTILHYVLHGEFLSKEVLDIIIELVGDDIMELLQAENVHGDTLFDCIAMPDVENEVENEIINLYVHHNLVTVKELEGGMLRLSNGRTEMIWDWDD